MIAISNFTGFIPKLDPTKLPDGAATVAVDCMLTSGSISGIPTHPAATGYTGNASGFVHVDTDGTKRIYTQSYDADFARSPVQQDSHKRFYWTGKNGSATEFKFARVTDNPSGGVPTTSYKVGVAQFKASEVSMNNQVDVNGNAMPGVTLISSSYYLGGYMSVPVEPPYEFSDCTNVKVQVILTDANGNEIKDVTSDVVPQTGGVTLLGVGDSYRGWYKQYSLVMAQPLAYYNAVVVASTAYTKKEMLIYVAGSTLTAATANVWYKTSTMVDGSKTVVPAYAEITDGQQVTDIAINQWVQVGALNEAPLGAKLISPTRFSVDGSAYPPELSTEESSTAPAASGVTAATALAIRVSLDYNGITYTALFHQDAMLSQAFAIGSGISGAVSKVDDTHWTLNLIFGEDLALEQRAYIFTLVNQFGEESAPFGPVELTLNPGRERIKFYVNSAGWTKLETYAFSGRAPIHGMRLYRTAPGTSTTSNYYYVGLAKKPLETSGLLPGDTYLDTSGVEGNSVTFYDDTKGTALGEACTTIDFVLDTAELQKLQGLTTLYNGVLAAFKDNEVWYSEPYKPWCWKRSSVHTLPHRIVALLPQEQGVYILTDRFPYYASGASPDQMVPTRIPAQFPCIYGKAATVVNGSAVYVSPDGLVFLEGGNARLDTMAFNRETWRRDWTLYSQAGGTVSLAAYGHRMLVCFSTPVGSVTGYVYDMDTQAWTTMTQAVKSHIVVPPGTFGLPGDNLAVWPGSGNWLTFGTGSSTALWEWQSKDFVLEKPSNFSAAQLFGTGSVTLKVYADGVLKHTVDVTLADTGTIVRLPAGFLSGRWSFNLKAKASGTVLKALHVAVGIEELRRV